jgi:outer membrane protein assembly factor BamB
MQKHKRIAILIVLLILLQLCAVPLAASLIGDWPMFRQNPNRNGAATSNNTAASAGLLWNYTTGGSVSSSPAVAGGCVYVGSKDGYVYCFNASSGEKFWGLPTGTEVSSSPAVSDGRVYVGSDDGWFYCLDSATGIPVWIEWLGWNLMWATRSSPLVADGCVYVGSGDHDVFCFNASDGSTLWRYPTSRPVMTSPAISNGVLYFAAGDFYVYALNASTGAELWRTPTGTDMSSPCVYNGCVYIGSYEGYLYCMNASTGALMWGFQTGDTIVSSPAAAEGCVYVGSYDNSVYAVNASNGHKIWQTQTGYWVYSSPAITDGNLYVGSEDYNIYCLDASTGAIKWRYQTGDYVDSSPAVADGILYVGSHDYQLYALALNNSTDETLSAAAFVLPLTWTTIVFDVAACFIGGVIIFLVIRHIQSTRLRKDSRPSDLASKKTLWLHRHADALCLLAIGAFSALFFVNLGNEFLWAADEKTYSQMAYYMLKTGDYLTPSAFGESALWTGKPPLLMWLMSLSYQVFGINNFAARFWLPLFGALSLVFVFYLGKKLYNRATGLLAALVLGTFTTFYAFATHAMFDVPLVCLVSASLYFFILSQDGKHADRYAALSGVCFGLAFLTKQTGALLIPAILIIYLILSKRSIKPLLTKQSALFFGAALLVFMPWLIYMSVNFGDGFWNNYFTYSIFTRAASPIEGHTGSNLYYFEYLGSNENLLWIALLPFAIGFSVYLAVKRSKADILVVSWAAIVLAIFTFSQTKIYYYILPAYPAFALAIGNLLYQAASMIARKRRRG